MEIDLQRFYNVNRRALMWVAFFAILILLRDFFAVMFLTFIFGFVMRSVAKLLNLTTGLPYRLAVIVPYLLAVGLLALLTTVAVPRILSEAAEFSRKAPLALEEVAKGIRTTAADYGLEDVLDRYLKVADADTPLHLAIPTTEPVSSRPGDTIAPIPVPESQVAPGETATAEEKDPLVAKIQDLSLKFLPDALGDEEAYGVQELLGRFVQGLIRGSMQFFLALVLSFLIVLDFEAIKRELQTWRQSNVGKFFHEAAASVVDFSHVVGRAFQCQIVVALLNASITAIGLFVLSIGPLMLLTTIVFLFGLIPVLGVFVSSVPIILIAFNDHGLAHAVAALLVIIVVHLLEAYVFNPRIYAARFHLNPVIVLIILLVAHEVFGVWGMLLGIPVTHYVLNIAQMPRITRKSRSQSQAEESEEKSTKKGR